MRQYPRQDLLRDCPVPSYEPGHDWNWIAGYAFRVRDALIECNKDKGELRDWAAGK